MDASTKPMPLEMFLDLVESDEKGECDFFMTELKDSDLHYLWDIQHPAVGRWIKGVAYDEFDIKDPKVSDTLHLFLSRNNADQKRKNMTSGNLPPVQS